MTDPRAQLRIDQLKFQLIHTLNRLEKLEHKVRLLRARFVALVVAVALMGTALIGLSLTSAF